MKCRLFMLVPLVLAVGGCQPLRTPHLSGAGMDMFTPVKMRVHPLSRIVRSGSAPALEARLELTDQFADITKGIGAVGINLFAYSTLLPNHKGERLHHWDKSLVTPEDNREHWDGITRTYLFSLPLDGVTLPADGKLVLSADFTLSNDQRLSDDLTISVK